jgi:hypothetical protein
MELEEWTSVPIGSPRDRMKQLGSHTTAEQTNKKQEQEFGTALKRNSFTGLGEREGKNVRVCWAGNQRVREWDYKKHNFADLLSQF